ncbi:MAG: RsmE family RNA methyltransferase [Flavobacteriales bacterium]
MHLFHCTELGTDLIELPEEEAHHATAVLRLTVGEHVGLLDGKGTRAEAELMEVTKRRCLAQVRTRVVHPPERAARIHLAVAPTKQMDRYEWFVEKAVEIGVDRITPLITDRTERSKLRIDRLLRVAVSAMKQSQRTWLPRIDELTTLQAVIAEVSNKGQRYFGWCQSEPPPLMTAYAPTSDALVLIGPEGDFSPEEAALLGEYAFTAVSLGQARLRTETAALAACSWMSLAQQR